MRKVLTVKYDVSKLTEPQIDALMLEAVVQAEASDEDEFSPGHPDVDVISAVVAPDTSFQHVPDVHRHRHSHA